MLITKWKIPALKRLAAAGLLAVVAAGEATGQKHGRTPYQQGRTK